MLRLQQRELPVEAGRVAGQAAVRPDRTDTLCHTRRRGDKVGYACPEFRQTSAGNTTADAP